MLFFFFFQSTAEEDKVLSLYVLLQWCKQLYHMPLSSSLLSIYVLILFKHHKLM